MTADKQRKKAIRARMADTGEPYAVAARHLADQRAGPPPFAGAWIALVVDEQRGPRWGPGLHSHISTLTACGERADGTPLRPADAVAPLPRPTEPITVGQLADKLTAAYPGATISLADGGADDDPDGDTDTPRVADDLDGEPWPILFTQELTQDCTCAGDG